MNKFLELITVPIEEGGQSRFELSGDYFEIIESAYPITVLLEDRNGAQIGRMGGAEASYFLRDTPFQAITIKSSKAQTVTIAFGTGEAGTRRTSGVVQIVDGAKARTVNSTAFLGATVAGPSVGNLGVTQLWNPAASGKRLIVSKISISGAEASEIGVGFNSVALSTLSLSYGSKLNSPNVASAGQLRNQVSATSMLTRQIFALYMQSLTFMSYEFKEPVVINPGGGFLIQTAKVNVNVISNFEWFEENI